MDQLAFLGPNDGNASSFGVYTPRGVGGHVTGIVFIRVVVFLRGFGGEINVSGAQVQFPTPAFGFFGDEIRVGDDGGGVELECDIVYRPSEVITFIVAILGSQYHILQGRQIGRAV